MTSGLGSNRDGPATPITPTAAFVLVSTIEIVSSKRFMT